MILKRIITFNVLLYLLCCNSLNGQELNRLISLSLENQRLDSLVSCLSSLTGYEFSYNPEIIPADTIISVEYENKYLRFILDDFRKYAILPNVLRDIPIIQQKLAYNIPDLNGTSPGK